MLPVAVVVVVLSFPAPANSHVEAFWCRMWISTQPILGGGEVVAARAEGWQQWRRQEGSGGTTATASSPPPQRRLSYMRRSFGIACGSLADSGGIGGGAGAGRRMAEVDGKGLLMLAHIKTAKNEVVCKLFCECFQVFS